MAAARTWTLIILAVPLLYVVTEPPIHRALREREFARSFVSSPGTGAGAAWTVPRWLVAYNAPYKWLESQPVIGQPIYRYRVWWSEHYRDFFPK